jgi:hypothetical protein
VMSVLVRQKSLNFKPGEKYEYSNTGFTLLGIIVSRVSGMSLREFTTKNIFEPLGMTHTHFRDDHEEVIKHDALGYKHDDPDKPFRLALVNFDTVGAAGLHTTVEDLQLWDENFYHPRVGGTALIQQMVEPGKLNSGELLDYASGLMIGTYKGLPTVDHGGYDGGYFSDMVRFPEQHFTAVVLCNRNDVDPIALARQVADIVLAKDVKAPEPTPAKAPAKTSAVALTAAQRTEIVGTYWNHEGAMSLQMLVKDGGLAMGINGDSAQDLRPYAPGHFHSAALPPGVDVDIQYVAASAGKPSRVEVTSNGGAPATFERVAAFDPSAAQLAEYPGAYVSEEIDPIFRIALQDGKLTLNQLKRRPETLRPITQDVFLGDNDTIRFTRDANRKISGFILDSDRIQNFKFTRKAN